MVSRVRFDLLSHTAPGSGGDDLLEVSIFSASHSCEETTYVRKKYLKIILQLNLELNNKWRNYCTSVTQFALSAYY